MYVTIMYVLIFETLKNSYIAGMPMHMPHAEFSTRRQFVSLTGVYTVHVNC